MRIPLPTRHPEKKRKSINNTKKYKWSETSRLRISAKIHGNPNPSINGNAGSKSDFM
jgi:hypothetical protein